jgi:uncharacterized membrane protein
LFTVYDPVVWGMAGVRFFSSTVEFTAAVLMLYYGRAETALKINAVLSVIGPVILCTVTLLGLCGLAGRLLPAGFLAILGGVTLIFYGLKQLR